MLASPWRRRISAAGLLPASLRRDIEVLRARRSRRRARELLSQLLRGAMWVMTGGSLLFAPIFTDAVQQRPIGQRDGYRRRQRSWPAIM